MRLRIEKDFDVTNVVTRRTLEIGPGQIVEILLGYQYLRTGVVNIQERLQVAKVISTTNVLDTGIRKLDAISLGQLHHQLGLQ